MLFLGRFESYTKDQIALAPNNPSAWNYLRGILEHTNTPFASLDPFVQLYIAQTAPVQEVLDLENPAPGPEAQLPCVAALEFNADILERKGGTENIQKAAEVWLNAVECLKAGRMLISCFLPRSGSRLRMNTILCGKSEFSVVATPPGRTLLTTVSLGIGNIESRKLL